MRNRILAELGEARVENGEMTFGELKDLVPAVRPGKLPNAKKLADEEILIERHTEDSDLIIYKSGHVVYTRTDSFGKPHMTVNAVNRCCRMVYQVNFSKQERDEEDYETRTFDCLADEIQYRRIDGKAVKINVINDSHYVNLPWWLPITMIDEISRDELYKWAEDILRPAAEEADRGDGEFHAGDWCRFCKARSICRERAKENLARAAYEFASPPLLEDEEIAEILDKVDRLVSWANDIKEYARQEALAGKEWPGWKLVEGRSNRKYVNEKEVAAAAEAAGYDPYQKKLLPITDMEKLMGKKKFEEILGELCIKPQGKPVV